MEGFGAGIFGGLALILKSGKTDWMVEQRGVGACRCPRQSRLSRKGADLCLLAHTTALFYKFLLTPPSSTSLSKKKLSRCYNFHSAYIKPLGTITENVRKCVDFPRDSLPKEGLREAILYQKGCFSYIVLKGGEGEGSAT